MDFHAEYRNQADWLEDAAEVFSRDSHVDSYISAGADTARDVLEAAGIPCHVEFIEEQSEEEGLPPTHRWRVLVPGKLNIQATNILDRDIFNDDFEALWRTHLEMLTDDELSGLEPHAVFCGLIDRIERAVRVYGDEMAKRGLGSR